MERNFEIKGATHSDNNEVIWICRFFGEPFNVTPTDDSKVRQKQWLSSPKYFGKMLRVTYTKATKRGVPTENILGTLIENKKV